MLVRNIHARCCTTCVISSMLDALAVRPTERHLVCAGEARRSPLTTKAIIVAATSRWTRRSPTDLKWSAAAALSQCNAVQCLQQRNGVNDQLTDLPPDLSEQAMPPPLPAPPAQASWRRAHLTRTPASAPSSRRLCRIQHRRGRCGRGRSRLGAVDWEQRRDWRVINSCSYSALSLICVTIWGIRRYC